MPSCVEILLEKMQTNQTVTFSHGKAIYFDKDNISFESWKYFNEISGVYDLNKDTLKRLLNFSYVCFGGCLIKKSVWNKINSRLENEKLIIENSLDILIIFLLFESGNVYFHNDTLVKVRMENDLRNQNYTYTIKDILLLWNFIENDEFISIKLQDNSLGIYLYKKNNFILLYKFILLEFFTKKITISEFKDAINNLELFNINENFKLRFIKNIVLFSPKLSIYLYTLLKK
jgi:hypothetical protein